VRETRVRRLWGRYETRRQPRVKLVTAKVCSQRVLILRNGRTGVFSDGRVRDEGVAGSNPAHSDQYLAACRFLPGHSFNGGWRTLRALRTDDPGDDGRTAPAAFRPNILRNRSLPTIGSASHHTTVLRAVGLSTCGGTSGTVSCDCPLSLAVSAIAYFRSIRRRSHFASSRRECRQSI